MGITTTLDYPFSSGAGTLNSDVVPGLYPVALDGHPYHLDTDPVTYRILAPLRHQPIPLLRTQNDTGTLPGEQSLSSEGLWLRPTDSWHYGAGQTYFDKVDSNPRQFHQSKGINVWTKWQMGLLQDTLSRRTSTILGTTMVGMSVGNCYYVLDGGELYWTTDLTPASPTWTSANVAVAESAGVFTAFATDGYTIYAASLIDGVHTTTRGAIVSTHYSDTQATDIWYVRGRLIAAKYNILYNIIAAGAAPTPLYTHPNGDFVWIDAAESLNSIYLAGYSGDKSFIYQLQVKADGTALSTPVIAAELPDGELVQSIQGYLGYLLIGSTAGVRLAATDSSGNLTLGGLIKTPAAVYAFEPQDRFIWFGYTNYDDISTGLGRVDLSVFTGPLVPAYASDLMVNGQGFVSSISTFQDRRVFTVTHATSQHVYIEDLDRKVVSGTLDSGLITYGLPYSKIAYFLDVQYKSLVGTHIAYIATEDGGAFTSIGQHVTGGDTSQFTINQLRSVMFELRQELRRDTTDTNVGPVLSRYTLKAFPAANTGMYISAALLLTATDRVPGSPRTRNVNAEIHHIQTLKDDQTLVTWQEGTDEYTVVVSDYDWRVLKVNAKGDFFEGTCLTQMKVVV